MKIRELFEEEKIYKVYLEYGVDENEAHIGDMYDGDDPVLKKRLADLEKKKKRKTYAEKALDAASDFARPFGVTAKIHKAIGDGDWRNPDIEFSGTRKNLEKFVLAYFHGDEDEAEDVMADAV